MFRSTRSKNKERLKQACSTAVSALQTTLRIAKEAAGDAGVPGLKAGMSGLLLVLDLVKKTSQNAEDIEKLSKQIEGFNLILQNSKNGGTLSQVAIDRINRLFTTSNTALKDLQKMASRHALNRFIHSDDDVQLISSHIQAIAWSMQAFTAETTLAIESAVDQVKARLDVKDKHPPHASLSPFNCKDRASCLEGTRTDILGQIFSWIGVRDSLGPLLESPIGVDTCVFWINGSAGTGKTTIAYTVAEVCRTFDILGASFFCSRDDADCSNPNLIFTSIAYQLGIFSSVFRAEVTRVMESNPEIGYTTPSYQLQELIIKPLRTLGDLFSPCVVVLDALDECKEIGTTSIILSSLSRHINELSPLKFLVTSRPESHITTVFKSSALKPVTRRYVLHEVELGVVQTDIERYLSTKLAFTRELYHLENEWPSVADIHALTQKSFGLFIFASTTVMFIEDRNYCDPKHQLGRLLCNAPTVAEDLSPDSHLDQLYSQVLNDAFPNISSHLSGRLKTILGTIVLLRDPLSSVAIEQLLDVPPRTVGMTLQRLHSVIMVPDEDTQVIRTLHPSFFDFITNPTRCLNPKYVVDPQIQHTLLACACLNVMKQLKRDICGIRNPSLLNCEVDDLPTRVMVCIPPELRYSCRHWAWHLQNAMFSDVLVDLLKEFCLKYLLYWIEVLSLIGDLRGGLLALDVAQKAIARADRGMTDAKDMLHDCERFTREFFLVISSSSLQIYRSGLLFTPQQTLMKKIYGRELDPPMKIYHGLDDTWSSCIRTIEGHIYGVLSLAFSPDGTRIVSGSGDTTVRLWDVVSGAHLNTLAGHPHSVNSVIFSQDGTCIVSGSDYGTVRLWDAISGACLVTLEGHSSRVNSVAFSPDDTQIVSGSDDHTVRLWDSLSGAHLNTLNGHSDPVSSVTFSQDGTRIVSGSWDNTVRLWDPISGACLVTLEGHSNHVGSVAFSPDGTRIVSGSDDRTVRLWDAISGVHLNTLEGHSDLVRSVSFSPDGTRIVSGSYDNTVRLWDSVSGTHLNTLKGHSDSVYSVAFSQDGTRIVSGSRDNTVRLWDAVGSADPTAAERYSYKEPSVTISPDGTRVVFGSHPEPVRLLDAVSGSLLNTLEGDSDSVLSVSFSLDGTRIVSGSRDNTIRLWDAVSGTHLNTLEGHSSEVCSVVFSPDGTRIVSGSSDYTVRLWDVASGAHLDTLEGHSDEVWSVAFSPDGTRIVSGASDATVRLWDAASGAHLNTLEVHSGAVTSVAFSPDGTRILSGSTDHIVRLWDAVGSADPTTSERHSGWVLSFIFFPDGRRIASGSNDNTSSAIRDAHLDEYPGDFECIVSVTFSPDGTRIASGSEGDTVRLWDTASGAHLITLRVPHTLAEWVARSYSLCQNSLTRCSNLAGPVFGYIALDGWVHSITWNRRICWIPVSCRPHTLVANGDRMVLGRKDGRIIVLDFASHI